MLMDLLLEVAEAAEGTVAVSTFICNALQERYVFLYMQELIS